MKMDSIDGLGFILAQIINPRLSTPWIYKNKNKKRLCRLQKWASNSCQVLRYIHLKRRILEQTIIEYISLTENMNLIDSYSSKLSLNTIDRGSCRDHGKSIDHFIDTIVSLIRKYADLKIEFTNNKSKESIQANPSKIIFI